MSDPPRKTKIEHRPGNVTPAPAALTEADRQAMSEELEDLFKRAEPGMQQQLDLTRAMTPARVGSLVLLVMDGTSRLADLGGPEFARKGAHGCAARLVDREKLSRLIDGFSTPVGEALRVVPPCGHLGYLVSTARTGLLGCVTCDRGLRPRKGQDRPS